MLARLPSVVACVAAVVALAGVPATSLATNPPAPDFKTRSAARTLGEEGIRLFAEGKYAEALDRFQRADKLVPAPTLGVRAARCLVRLGRLVEASEQYLEVTRFRLDERATQAFRQAVREAEQERDLLLPRLPKLKVVLTGPLGKGVVVQLDAKELPAELLDAAMPVDPGRHEVSARREDVTVTDAAVLNEGQIARLELRLPALPPAKAPKPAAKGFDYELAAYVSFGVGAGGLVAAAVNGGIALGQQAALEERCPNRSCPPEAYGAADAYDVARYATTVGFVLAGVGLAGGGAALLVARAQKQEVDDPAGEEPSKAVLVSPYLGPGSAGLNLSW